MGLALGGGGARGFAHIGVLKVLEAEGILPGLLSGTSMGGIVAAFLACGLSTEQMEKEARRLGKLPNIIKLLGDDFSNLDYLVSGDSVTNYLSGIKEINRQFDQVEIPLALCSVDMLTGEIIALQDGKILEALNATIALPGIIEPVCQNGKCLIDGGSLNNVPSDFVRSMGAEVVVAVDVSPDIKNEKFWKEQRLPAIAAANWRTNAIMVAHITSARQRAARTDLIIRPELLPDITTLSGFKYLSTIIEAGAHAATENLPAIKKLLKKKIFFFGQKIVRAEPVEL